jgi:stage II sporulation protein AA (anti-sigma F factor antagonist)
MAKLDLNVVSKENEAQKYQVVQFKGEMDKSNNLDVREALNKFVDNYTDDFLFFDLTYFDFINSEGVGMMVSFYYKLKKANKNLVIVAPQPRVSDVFNIIGLPKIVPIFETIDLALIELKI